MVKINVRSLALGVLILAGTAILPVAPLFGAVADKAPSRFDRLVILDPSTRLGVVAEAPDVLPGFDTERAGWDAFRKEVGGAWSVQIDRRSGAPLFVQGSGLRFFAADGTAPALAAVESMVRDLVVRHESLFKIRNAELVLAPEGSGPVDKDHWILLFTRQVSGVPVDNERFLVNVTRGNLVAFGADRWGAISSLPAQVYDAATARQVLMSYMTITPSDRVEWLDLGTRILGAEPKVATNDRRYLGAVGEGIGYHLAYRMALRVAGERGVWVGKVDATTGQVLALNDDVKYAQVKGGVFPISDDGNCTDGCEQPNWPMPFADVTINGTPQTAGNMGSFSCTPSGGTGTTHLSSTYFRVNDTCGAISENVTCDNDLDLQSTPGTDCQVPAGSSPGNTHSSRTGFYHLNRTNERSRHWLPNNTWLQGQVTDNVNLNQTCNAYWDGVAVNFFKSGGGCRNTGEIAGVFLHEYGHGLDENDGGGYDDPTETYADVNAVIALHKSCVGRGFYMSQNCDGYGDACLNCTGIRDQDWNMHVSHTPATPANYASSHCGGGDSPCGKEQHCETYVGAEAVYDLATRDLTAAGLDQDTAWQLAEKLWYKSRQGSGGNAYNCSLPSSDGCGTGSWFAKFRNIDDDDGNLSNGTPHAAAIYAAFNRHAIACGASTDASNQSTSSCPSLATPTISVAPGSNAITVSWSPVANAADYLILRNDSGCGDGSVVVATVAAPGTSYVDTGLPNGFPLYYTVQAEGTNAACSSAVSACQSGAAQPFAGSISFGQAAYTCSSTIQITVRDGNIGGSTTTVTISSNTEPTPETVVLTATAPGSSVYQGTITVDSGPPVAANGVLSIANGDTITGQYVDADDGQGGHNIPHQTTAVADCVAPLISAVQSSGVTDVAGTVTWSTNEASNSSLHWGQLKPPSSTTSNSALVSQHSIGLTGLQQCTVYYYSVESRDGAGNDVLDNSGGQYYHFETEGNFGNGLQPCHAGKLTLGTSTVSCSSSLPIQVIDIDLNVNPTVADTVAVKVSSASEPGGETVVLTETGPNTSIFTGSIATSGGVPVAGDGVLQTKDGEPLTGTYHDADDGTGAPAVSFQTATADCAAPIASTVQVSNIHDDSLSVTWSTSELATGRVDWGTTTALGNTVTESGPATSHGLSLAPIAECGHIYFRVTSTDVYGNVRVTDVAGAPFEANDYIIPSFFKDDFETTTGWTLEGEWQINAPLGKGSGTPDPSAAFSGSKVLGHDLTGLGANPGDYEPTVTQSATSPVINATSLANAQLKFRRWLNVGGGAISYIDVKKGSVWNTVFQTTVQGNSESSWSFQTIPISTFADGNSTLQIRFRQYGGISSAAHRSGWNVDRFIVHSGNTPDYDACGGCGGAPTFAGLQSATDVSGCADTGVALSWNVAPAWGTGHAGSYSVYRDPSPTFTPAAGNRIATGVAGTSYTDATAPNGVDLYYIVRAENDETCSTGPKNGGVTDSNLIRVKGRDETSQPAPGSLGATLLASPVNAAHVRLSWAAQPSAASYHVYRGATPGGSFTMVANVTGTFYDDVNAMGNSSSFYYVVRTADSCGNEGP